MKEESFKNQKEIEDSFTDEQKEYIKFKIEEVYQKNRHYIRCDKEYQIKLNHSPKGVFYKIQVEKRIKGTGVITADIPIFFHDSVKEKAAHIQDNGKIVIKKMYERFTYEGNKYWKPYVYYVVVEFELKVDRKVIEKDAYIKYFREAEERKKNQMIEEDFEDLLL